LDVRLAEADAAAAREQVGRAEKETELASERLRVLLGASAARGRLRALAGPEHEPVGSVDALRERAWAGRPDLRAQEIAIAAAAQRAKWERSRLYVLAAALNSKRFLGRDILTGPALQLDAPVFRTNAGGVARADAEVEQAARQYAAAKQRIDLEVSEAHLRREQAAQSVAEWEGKVLPALEAAMENARSAYAKGDVSYLFVLESSRQAVDAEARRADLRTDLLRAEAELDRSIGK
jgi:outer membrane protein, heavy metal efflux system